MFTMYTWKRSFFIAIESDLCVQNVFPFNETITMYLDILTSVWTQCVNSLDKKQQQQRLDGRLTNHSTSSTLFSIMKLEKKKKNHSAVEGHFAQNRNSFFTMSLPIWIMLVLSTQSERNGNSSDQKWTLITKMNHNTVEELYEFQI